MCLRPAVRFVWLVAWLLGVACRTSPGLGPLAAERDVAAQPRLPQPEPTPVIAGSIRDVAWQNRTNDFGDGPAQFVDGYYNLLDGRGDCQVCQRIRAVVYGDVDGDQREEALVLVSTNLGGSGTDLSGFLYRLAPAGPVLVSKLEGGDRAMGGVESVTIQEGELVVRRLDGQSACCPDHIQTQRWRLIGGTLVMQGASRAESRQARVVARSAVRKRARERGALFVFQRAWTLGREWHDTRITVDPHRRVPWCV